MKIIHSVLNEYRKFVNNKNSLYVVTGMLFFIFVFFTIQKYRGDYAQWQENDIAKHDIKLYKDVDIVDHIQTENDIQKIKQTTPPIFVKDDNLVNNTMSQIQNYFSVITDLKKSSLSYNDQVKKLQKVNTNIPMFAIFYLLRFPNSVKRDFLKIVNKVYEKGLVQDYSIINSKKLNQFFIYHSGSKTLLNVSVNDVFFDEFFDISKVISLQKMSQNRIKVLRVLTKAFLQPNIYYDVQKTAVDIQDKIKKLPPSYKHLRKNMVVVRSGESISKEKADVLNQLQSMQSHSLLNLILSVIFFYSIWFFIVFIYIHYFGQKIIKRKKYFFVLYFFVLFFFFLNYYISTLDFSLSQNVPSFVFIPIIIAGIFFPVFFNFSFSLLMTSHLLFLSYIFFSGPAIPYIFSFFIAIFTIFLALLVRQRNKAFLLAFYILLFNAFLVLTYSLFFSDHISQFLNNLYFLSINTILSFIIGLGIITFTESIFNIPTDYKLLELSDLNKPIFKELLLKAPGTYHHSILVANLSEAGAVEIMANSLLVRVAAYYHDIGKIDYAEYYTENEIYQNKMEQFTPSLSVSLVKAHLKKSIERAKHLHLPEEVIELIAQHHGKSVIKFFYFKALQTIDKGKEKIHKEDYMYESENPQTREAAVLLLADSVEAASRSLKNPTPASISALLDNVVDTKFEEGVLDECDITFKEVTKIKKAFSRVLFGFFHTRVSYPKDQSIKDEEKRHSENGEN